MTWGEKIRLWRKAAGLTQKELGLLCGYKASSAERTIQFWEKDLREPSLKNLRPLAEALHVSLEELIP